MNDRHRPSELTDQELLHRIETLSHEERSVGLSVLHHLIEIERRKLHLLLGYPSMFGYCTRGLGYSESAASRRVRCARALRDHPELHDLLAANRVSLSTLSRVAGVLNAENKAGLLERVCGKSQAEVEAIVSEFRPRSVARDRVSAVTLQPRGRRKRAPAESARGLWEAPDPCAKPAHQAGNGGGARDTGDADDAGDAGDAGVVGAVGGFGGVRDVGDRGWPGGESPRGAAPETSSEEALGDFAGGEAPLCGDWSGNAGESVRRLYRLEIYVEPDVLAKIEQVRALISTRARVGSGFAELLQVVVDDYLDRHSPRRRRRRRESRRRRRGESSDREDGAVPPPGEAALAAGSVSGGGGRRGCRGRNRRSRRLPAGVRDQVFCRDGGRCSYVGSNGVRCGATRRLQVDHVVPFARGGASTVDNLRVLCAQHNRVEAEREFGRDHMSRFARVSAARCRDPAETG